MSRKSISEQLLALTPDATDIRVADLLSHQMLELSVEPYEFAINHDIRPPKMLACPLEYDWSRRDRVGVRGKTRLEAQRWLVKALLLGYTAYYTGLDKRLEKRFSIQLARGRAAMAQLSQGLSDDDDIPF